MDDTTRGVGDGGRRTPRGTGAVGPTTRAKRSGSAGDAALDADTDKRTRELQAEIAETRDEMSETVEAIQEKLKPSNIMAESTEAVKAAATERMRDMADSATDTAERFVEDTRQNPWPALMIAAGVTWMLVDRARDGGTYRSGPYRTYGGRTYPSRYRASTRTGEGMYSDDESDAAWSSNAEYGGARGYSGGARETSGGTWRSGTWGQNQDWNQGWNQGQSMRQMTRNAQNGVHRMLHENPLLVAAAAILAGAAVGGALPQTDKENELMGEARDQMVDKAQEAAREAVDSVREVGRAVQDVTSQFNDPAR